MANQTPPEGEETQTNQALAVDFNRVTKEIFWAIARIAIKAVLIVYLANHWLLPYLGFPPIEFGHAFALVATIWILFANLDGYSKFNNAHLFEIRQILNQLHINQFYQNKSIGEKLDKLANDVDENKKSSYNTEESEKK